MNPILECSGLSKQYTSGCYALNNLNLSLERGQIIGLLGPNGSGKTTFIKLINDLLTPHKRTDFNRRKTAGCRDKSNGLLSS